MSDSFGKYFENMFKRADLKSIQRALTAARRSYEAAYEEHLKAKAAAHAKDAKVMLKAVSVQSATGPTEPKKTKKKSLSEMTHHLTTRATQENAKEEVKETTPVETRQRAPRKAPPQRRASGTSGASLQSPTPPPPPPEPRRSVRTQEKEEFKETKELKAKEELKVKEVKLKEVKVKEETKVKEAPKMMPRSVKDSLLQKSEPASKQQAAASSTNIVKASATIKLAHLAAPPSPSPQISPSTPLMMSPSSLGPALFDIGDRVEANGKAAIVEKVLSIKGRREYLIRVENGPKMKQAESELKKMSKTDFVVRPLVDQLITDILMKHERKQREAKRLDPTGRGEQSPFFGVENQFKCTGENCNKSFRKERGLEAHIKHYHPELVYSPVTTPKSTPSRHTPKRTPKHKNTPSPVKRIIVSESEDDTPSVVSAPKSERSVDEIDTMPQARPHTYQCSCGWEGAEFWSQNPSGVPIRNHICQRPHKARNLKETQVMREMYRTVDMGDYYDDFKLQVFPDTATQEMVREANLVQNEIEQRVWAPCQKIRERLRAIRPQIEQMSSQTPDDVSFSVAEGVSTAQNAFPDTFDEKHTYTEQELTLLKTVDANDQVLMDSYKENNECGKLLDEFEQYIDFMERDLDQKLLAEQNHPEVQLTLNE